jgi:hypothetical protein
MRKAFPIRWKLLHKCGEPCSLGDNVFVYNSKRTISNTIMSEGENGINLF